jgi:hypothetical protein
MLAHVLRRPWNRNVRRSRLVSPRSGLEPLEDRGLLAIYLVANTSDIGPGSLWEAILDANANAGSAIVSFTIGCGVQPISPSPALPIITGPVTIDGTTQPGFAGTPIIELNGSSAGAGENGLNVRPAWFPEVLLSGLASI